MKHSKILRILLHLSYKNYIETMRFVANLNDKDRAHLLNLQRNTKDIKNSSEERQGEWGYYISDSFAVTDLVRLLRKYKVDSVIDLGCGVGHVVSILHHFGFHSTGIEIEPLLVDLGNRLANHIIKGDILQPFNIKKGEAVYFYEPFTTQFTNNNELLHKKAKLFVENLENTLPKDTMVFYNPAGCIGMLLTQSTKFKHLPNRTLIKVFKKL